jgi:alpha 1,2-mannosyltransferase
MTDTNQRSTIESLGATIHQIQGVTKSAGAWKNWQIKGLALVQSSFQELISLDSDNAPLSDISHLFDSTTYTLHGKAVFWPDLNKDHPSNAIWRLVGEQCTLDDWSFESGQMVIDKAGNGGLNLAALYLASGMLDDKDFWFKMCGGDKDTFRWAWRILDLDFGRSPRWMSSVGIVDKGRYCGQYVPFFHQQPLSDPSTEQSLTTSTVLQYDLTTQPGQDRPRPLFAHS